MLPRAGDLVDDLAVAHRLGAFDPFLNSARVLAIGRWGPGIAAMVAASALRFPTRAAVIDDDRTIDYRTLDTKATNLAGYLKANHQSGSVGILCRNHSGFILAQIAVERSGIDVVMMSTALPAPKLTEVMEREDVRILIADNEFATLIEDSGCEVTVLSADGDGADSIQVLSGVSRRCPSPRRRSQLVLLTSGTTGPPKGARRPNRAPGRSDFAWASEIPYRLGDTYLVCSPLFHAWGLSQATSAIATSSTLILRKKFDAGVTMQLLAEHKIDVLAVVPLMLRRMLREPNPTGQAIKPPRLVLSSGNVLAGPLATEWMDRFGDHLYNLYGSTEAAIGTIAGPAELRVAPGTVGRPPRGVTLSILDDRGMPMPVGQRGRVFLSSSMQFGGYTDGTGGDRSGTMLATGDHGCVDSSGLLHIDGRVNDMIVTGGENVFPSRVEEVLDQHPDVEMSAVVGVADEDYGQRVVGFVVPRSGKTIDVEDLRAFAALDLQSFKVPREFVIVEALPMTTTGKVVRHRLAVLGQPEHV